ncbi:hypothetical protein V8G54_035806 [Vigna mungo]|uniref:Uncharacterized protein n=1 Tax=Vigna mungo TaxID=3915 RepID=A0AAQ3MFQ7_VIGMU
MHASVASLAVLVPVVVWFLLVLVFFLAYALSNLWYSATRSCSSWSPFGLLRLALGPHGGFTTFRCLNWVLRLSPLCPEGGGTCIRHSDTQVRSSFGNCVSQLYV